MLDAPSIPSRDCPPLDALHGFVTGKLDEGEAERLNEHLRHCQSCVQRVDTIRFDSDTVIEALRQVDTHIDHLDEPELTEGLSRLVSLGKIGKPLDENRPSPKSLPSDVVPEGKKPKKALDREETLGSYRLTRKLGQGGMGAVYLAVHTSLGKTVAVKVLSAARFGNREATDRFAREMKAMGRVEHPNVVTALDGGDVDGEHFLVMEYVDGVDIATLDRRHDGLPVEVACEIVRQAALGLQHAHEVGLIHRDIKPGNLMLDRKGVVKVLDLGLARITSDLSTVAQDIDRQGSGNDVTRSELTGIGTAMGTIGYMSPEQALDSRQVDARADLYSLGVTLFKLLTGTLPFSSEKYDTNGKMLVAIATKPPPSIGKLRPDLPPDLVTLIDRMLSKEPSRRLATAAQFADALHPFAGVPLAGLAAAAPGTIPEVIADVSPTVAPTLSKPRRWPLVATGVVILGAILFLAAQTFWIKTERGMLVVEIADEEVAATLKKNGIAIVDQKNNRVWQIERQTEQPKSLPAGEYRFEAPAGLLITDAQGLVIRSDEFRLVDENKDLRIRVSPADSLGVNGIKNASIGQSMIEPPTNPAVRPGKALFELVSHYGGTIRYQRKQDGEAVAEAKAWDELEEELEWIELDLNHRNRFDDDAILEMASLLKQIDFGTRALYLNLSDTPVSGQGLVSLVGVPIQKIETVQSVFDLSEYGNQLKGLTIESWNLGGGADAADIAAVAAMPSIQKLKIDINPAAESEENLHQKLVALTNTNATTIQIGSYGDPSEIGDRQIQLLNQVKSKNLVVAPFLDVTPAIRANWAAGHLRGDGYEFHGLVTVAATVPEEFVIEFDALRTSSKVEGIGIVFRFGESAGQVILGGWDGKRSALEQVNLAFGGDKSNPIKVAYDPFADGETHRVRVEVFRHAIGTQVDGQYQLWWHGDPSAITHFLGREIANAGEAFLVTHHGASFRVSNLTLKPLPADRFNPLPTESSSPWQEVSAMAQEFGGVVAVGPYGMTRPIDEHLRHVPENLPVHFSFRDAPNLNDQSLKQLREMIDRLPSFRFESLDLIGTSITPDGLLQFDGLNPGFVSISGNRAGLDIDPIADELAKWRTYTWDFGDSIGAAGLAAFAKQSSAGIYTVSAKRISPESLAILGSSKVTSLAIRFDGEAIDAFVPAIVKLSPLGHLHLLDCVRPTKQQIELLLRNHPESQIFWNGALVSSPVAMERMRIVDEVRAATSENFRREIAAAQWIESVGGEMHEGSPFGQLIDSADIAKNPGSLRYVDLSGLGEINDIGLHLADLPNLEVLFANDVSLDSDDLAGILTNPNIYWAQLKGTKLTSKDFRRLKALPRLNSLSLDLRQVDDEWEFVKEIPWLPEFQLSAVEPPPFDVLCKYPQLDTIWLGFDFQNSQTSEDELFALAQKAIVQNRNLRIGINGKLVGKDPVRAMARKLADDGWKFKGATSNWRDPWDSTAEDAWSEKDWFHVRNIIAPDNVRLSPELLEDLPALGHAFDEIRFRGATNLAGLPKYLRSRFVNHLDLQGSELDDATLVGIAKMSGVSKLTISNTDVSDKAIAAFKQAWPHCEVITNQPHFDRTLQGLRTLEAVENLEVASEVPREYELKFSLKRESGVEGAMLIHLPVMDRQVMVVISGYQKRRSGLDLIDGETAFDNETTRDGDALTDGKIHQVVVRVTEESIFTSVDGKTLIDWRGDKSRLSVPSWAEKKSLAITAGYETRLQIMDVSLKGLPDAGTTVAE